MSSDHATDKPDDAQTIGLRLHRSTVAAVDARLAALRRANPHASVSRSDVLRELLSAGLRVLAPATTTDGHPEQRVA